MFDKYNIELENPVDFDVLGYTSKVFWHFIRDDIKEDKVLEWTAIDRFNLIFNNAQEFPRLLVDPRNQKYHRRLLLPGEFGGKLDSGPNTDSIKVFEPRSLCFADIPFNFLPIHLKRYCGIGLGFKKEALQARVSDLKPVDYFSSVSDTFKPFFVKSEDTEKKEIHLKEYSKIPTENENPVYREIFEDIYLEREWRTFSDLEFYLSDVSMIVARTKEEKSNILKNEIVKIWLPEGLAVICLEELFPIRQSRGAKNE